MTSKRVSSLGWLLVPFCLYLAGVSVLGDWIIDDAGISFAYARNIAEGHGVVAQPGVAPVEGFSNFLWVLLLVPTFWLGVFDAVWLPKVVGALFMLSSLTLVWVVFRRVTAKAWPGWLAALLISASPALTIWTASGLENGLLLVLVIALWALVTLRPALWFFGSGALVACIAMTRPDGLVYAATVPLLSLLELAGDRRRWRAALRQSLGATLTFAAIWGPFLLYRLWRFGLPLPHTYYAKLAHSSQRERLLALFANGAQELRDKLLGLGEAFAGPLGVWLLGACLVLAAGLTYKRRLPRLALTSLVLLGLAAFAHVWLPDDWMGEYRFSTAAVALAWISLLALAEPLHALAPAGRRRDLAAAALALAGAAVLLPTNVSRLVGFARNPPTPYAHVKRQFGRRFDVYASTLGLESASILLADVGAVLFESHLRVYDAAGLIEPQIVRTIRKGTPIWHYDHPEFYDWVFEDIQPTFVVTYAFWSNVTSLDHDPRFARDYVALDSFPNDYARRQYGRELRSGEYVRRDVLGSADALERMRASYTPAPQPEPLVHRLADWLRPGPPPSALALRSAAAEALFTDHDLNHAAALLTRVLADAPDDVGTRELLATTLDRVGRAGDAHPEWQRLAQLPLQPATAALVARAQARLATIPEATALFEHGARLITLQRHTEARAALERSISLAPGAAAPFFLLGSIAQKEHRLDDAITHYRRCLALDPTHVDARNNLGFSLSVLGHPAEAVPILERAVELQPDHALALANLAWARSEASREAGAH